MSTYSSSLRLNDQFSKPLQSIVKAMHMTLNVMEQLNTATSRDIGLSHTIAMARGEVTSANREIQRMTQSVNQTTSGINNATNSQRQFNSEAQRSSGIFSSLKGVVGGLVGIFAVNKAVETLDNISNIGARLNLINDGSQTQAELQQKIYQAAQASRGEYSSMASSVGKLGILAKDAFQTNDEAIYFVQQMNKQFKIGGASIQEQSSAMYQLTQAMAAGKLQGDEFRSIMENAPMLAQAIAKEMGVPQGQLKQMGADGKITANIIKNAMINTAKETDRMFAQIPMTFGDIGNSIKNKLITSLTPIQQTITNLMNSAGGSELVNNIGNAVTALVYGINILLNAIISIGMFMQSNWGTIQPILMAITGAFILWGLTQIPMLTLKLWLMLEPIIAQAAAWLLINWPILLIGAAIGLLLYALLNFGDTAVQVTGVVGGVFGVLFGFLFNQFAFFANMILSVAEFFANVFVDPIYAVKKLFYDLSINSLSFLSNIAKGIENIINKIPGMNVDMTSGMTNILDRLQAERENLKSDKDVVKLMRFDQVDYGTSYNKGQEIGTQVGQFAVNGLQNISGMIGDKMNSLLNSQDDLFGNGNSQIGSIKSDVKIDAEDIKLLRDVAERDAVNKMSTLAPNISVSFGDVRETADVNGVVSRIKEILAEQISMSAEGAYG